MLAKMTSVELFRREKQGFEAEKSFRNYFLQSRYLAVNYLVLIMN